MAINTSLDHVDQDIAHLINKELDRQETHLELIAVSYTHLRAHET